MSNCVPCDGVFVFIFYKQCIITQPVRATPNQEFPSIYVEKRQNGERNSQKALCVPFLLSMGLVLGGRGQFISGRLANRLGSPFGMHTKLLHGVIGVIMII